MLAAGSRSAAPAACPQPAPGYHLANVRSWRCPGLAVMTLRDEVEERLPNWASWYPSVFDAARDLGLIRARVCSPSSLLLSNRHAAVRAQAEAAHRDKWGGPENLETLGEPERGRPGRRRRR